MLASGSVLPESSLSSIPAGPRLVSAGFLGSNNLASHSVSYVYTSQVLELTLSFLFFFFPIGRLAHSTWKNKYLEPIPLGGTDSLRAVR
jgi:hypothetical protein